MVWRFWNHEASSFTVISYSFSLMTHSFLPPCSCAFCPFFLFLFVFIWIIFHLIDSSVNCLIIYHITSEVFLCSTIFNLFQKLYSFSCWLQHFLLIFQSITWWFVGCSLRKTMMTCKEKQAGWWVFRKLILIPPSSCCKCHPLFFSRFNIHERRLISKTEDDFKKIISC